jgi:hypothetical protein
MPGPAPKQTRRRRNTPARGEWKPALGEGWQHGEIPNPPDGLRSETQEAWRAWFSAWFASYWTPDMLPGLRTVALAYDDVIRGGVKAADRTALHTLMRSYGMTPDGQMALRWQRPTEEEQPSQPQRRRAAGDRYAHLQVLGEERPA